MNGLIELERITVSGTCSEMGEQQGEAFRTRIQAFVEMRFAAVQTYSQERGLPSADGINDIGSASLELFRQWDPDGWAEHEGIARGAGVDSIALYTATNMTDMRDALLLARGIEAPAADPEGCSALLIPGTLTQDGNAIAGQTWDLNPPDIEYVVAINRQPVTGPETWSVTCVGCLTLMGINDCGLSVGTTNIKTYGSRPGIGYLATLHRMLRARSVPEAAALLTEAQRAGAHVFWMADPFELREYETSPSHIQLREARDGAVCHTNHCIAPGNIAIQGEEGTESSHRRLEMMEQTLRNGGQTVETVKTLFSDRSQGVLSINRYAEDNEGTATNAVFIAVPGRREAFACRGPADRGEWYRLGFSRS